MNYLEKQTSAQTAREAKLEKWESEPVWAPGIGKTTRRDFYMRGLIAKHTETEIYAKQKRNGYYTKLKTPRVSYMLVYLDREGPYFREVPKMFWDNVIAVNYDDIKDGLR